MGFQYDKRLEEKEGDNNNIDPIQWCPLSLNNYTVTLTNEWVGSGEIVLLSAMSGDITAAKIDLCDLLKGCWYVAVMELVHEPRVK